MKDKTIGNAISNPSLYEELSQPYATDEEANAALHEFFAAVRKLRKKHRIPEVHTVAAVNVVNGKGGYSSKVTRTYNGSTANELPLLAWAMGVAKHEANEALEAIAIAAAEGRKKQGGA